MLAARCDLGGVGDDEHFSEWLMTSCQCQEPGCDLSLSLRTDPLIQSHLSTSCHSVPLWPWVSASLIILTARHSNLRELQSVLSDCTRSHHCNTSIYWHETKTSHTTRHWLFIHVEVSSTKWHRWVIISNTYLKKLLYLIDTSLVLAFYFGYTASTYFM